MRDDVVGFLPKHQASPCLAVHAEHASVGVFGNPGCHSTAPRPAVFAFGKAFMLCQCALLMLIAMS